MDIVAVKNGVSYLIDSFYNDSTCSTTPFVVEYFSGSCIGPSSGLITDYFQLSVNVSGNIEVNFYNTSNGGCTGKPRKSVKTDVSALSPGGFVFPTAATLDTCTPYPSVSGIYYKTSATLTSYAVQSPYRVY
jgi:hypothetical protein